MTIHACLNFNGRCRDAFPDYAATCGGKIAVSVTFGEIPLASRTPADRRDKIAQSSPARSRDRMCRRSATGRRKDSASWSRSLILPKRRVCNALAEQDSIDMPLQERTISGAPPTASGSPG
jgi:PhnB protein